MANSEDHALIQARAKLIEEHFSKLTDNASASVSNKRKKERKKPFNPFGITSNWDCNE